MRIIKSAVGVALCFAIYLLRGQQGTPFYSALAVLWCIQSRIRDSLSNALQRVIGTAVGAVFGTAFILITLYISDFGYGPVHYLLLSAFIIPVIYLTVLMHKGNTSYFACVVYLSIAVNHVTDVDPFLFVLNRCLDTVIGIAVGLFVNTVHFHGPGKKDTLFAVDLDRTLKLNHDRLTPHSRVTLQNLIEDGIQLTIMTTKTPAAYLEAMDGIVPALPVIAMDGAVLYDQKENSFGRVHVISGEHSLSLEDRIRDAGFQLFTTVILDDLLLIYYDEPQNHAAKEIYRTLHRSPYRNYLRKKRPEGHPVVYFMVIDTDEKIEKLYQLLHGEGFLDGLKVVKYPSDEYEGFSYLKIYNQNASAENMLSYLKDKMKMDKVTVLSDREGSDPAFNKGLDGETVVNHLYKLYYSRGEAEHS